MKKKSRAGISLGICLAAVFVLIAQPVNPQDAQPEPKIKPGMV